MNKKISVIVEHLYARNHFSAFSSLFRIFICFHLLKDIYHYWDYIPLIYSDSSFYSSQPTYLLEFIGIETALIRENFKIFIFIYILAIIFYAFGIGRNITAIVLFLCLEIVQRLCHVILNGGDNLLKFCMLYMIFVDCFKYFVLNKNKINFTNKTRNFISNLGCYAILIHLCIIYFFSAIHKIHTDVWFNGIATYYTFSSERFNGTPWNYRLAKNGLFITLSTYYTLLTELSYPFLIWFRQTRGLMVTLALVLHVSIYIFMMIYDFQIVFIAVQGFVIKNSIWEKIFLLFQSKLQLWKKKY